MAEEANNQAPTESKREEARVAMQGPEWTAKREQEEKTKELEAEQGALNKRHQEITAEKEQLELLWVDLDDKRKTIRRVLNPILDEEKKTEAEEADLEAEEAGVGVPTEKHKVEEKRWVVQTKRRDIEQKKRAEEEKLTKIEQEIEANTKKYRGFLNEEDQIQTKLAQLKAEIIV